MCILCKDTFSRSDILKRHFQKCSIRRGNPTGATHLSSSQAHVRKNQGAGKKGSVSDADGRSGLDSSSNMTNRETSSNDASVAGLGISDFGTGAYESAPGSRSNSISRSSTGVDYGYRHSLNGGAPPGMPPQNYSFPPEHVSSTLLSTNALLTALDRKPQRRSGHSTQVTIPSREGKTPPESAVGDATHLNHAHEQYASPLHAASTATDWSHAYQYGGQDDPILSGFPSAPYDHSPSRPDNLESDTPYKYIFENRDSLLPVLFRQSMEDTPKNLHFWHFDDNHVDSYESISVRLIAFCFGDDYEAPTRLDEHEKLKTFLSGANVIHFLKLYSHFQGHWPLIHIPSFNPFDASAGLLSVLICLGAVYSDRIDLPQVRLLMEYVTRAMHRSTRLLHLLNSNIPSLDFTELESEETLQELQAWMGLQSLSAWHGNTEQRSKGRKDHQRLILLVRKLGLLEPYGSDSPFYSVLHQPSPQYEEICADPYLLNRWDWIAWVEQEKRCRFVHHIYLMDAALLLFFNTPPSFQYQEIRLPLPADDAAWEARSAQECAAALGLHDSHAQASSNTTGSLRKKQAELPVAINALFHPHYEIETRFTNIYSKFILIHVLLLQIWNIQRHLPRGPASSRPASDIGNTSGTTNASAAYEDRLTADDTSRRVSKSNNGHATPIEASGSHSSASHQLLRAINIALQKWKKSWDEDMALQYPPSSTHRKRLGFCRDGIHFYWLARLWLRSSRATDWDAAPDQRFLQSMNELKRVRHWVASDNATRGEEIGSVAEIAENYGIEDLTLDMKLLFAPIHHEGQPSIGGL